MGSNERDIVETAPAAEAAADQTGQKLSAEAWSTNEYAGRPTVICAVEPSGMTCLIIPPLPGGSELPGLQPETRSGTASGGTAVPPEDDIPRLGNPSRPRPGISPGGGADQNGDEIPRLGNPPRPRPGTTPGGDSDRRGDDIPRLGPRR